MKTFTLGCVIVVGALTGVFVAQQQPVATIGGGGQVSPSVTATYTGYGPPNGPWTLQLLVLWRGTPGWWATLRATTSIGGGGDGPVTHSVILSGRTLELQLDKAGQVRLGADVLDLGESNVLLIDDVDSATGPRIVSTARVQQSLIEMNANPLDSLLARSPDLFDFLQCDAPMPDPNMQEWMTLRCAQLREIAGAK